MKPLSPNDQKLLAHLTAIFASFGGSMGQEGFDIIFRNRPFGSPEGALQGWSGGDILWGGIGGGDRAQWLALLQYAVRVGLASKEGGVPNLIYHLPAKASAK